MIQLFKPTPTRQQMLAAAEHCYQSSQLAPGPATERAEKLISDRLGFPCIATSSATAALRVATHMLCPGIVWAPATTWPGTYCSLPRERLRFYDFGAEDTIGEADAILVELYGVPAVQRQSAGRRIVDAAHNLCGATHRSLLRSGAADAIVYSVGPTKELATPSGGFVVSPHITPGWREFLHYGAVGRRAYRVPADNGLMNEFSAALFCEQYSRIDELKQWRLSVLEEYTHLLGDEAMRYVRHGSGHVAILACAPKQQAIIREAMFAQGIQWGSHYPLPAFCPKEHFPRSHEIETSTITIPCHHALRMVDVKRVAEVIKPLLV